MRNVKGINVATSDDGWVDVDLGPLIVRMDWMGAMTLACVLRNASGVAANALDVDQETFDRVCDQAEQIARVGLVADDDEG